MPTVSPHVRRARQVKVSFLTTVSSWNSPSRVQRSPPARWPISLPTRPTRPYMSADPLIRYGASTSSPLEYKQHLANYSPDYNDTAPRRMLCYNSSGYGDGDGDAGPIRLSPSTPRRWWRWRWWERHLHCRHRTWQLHWTLFILLQLRLLPTGALHMYAIWQRSPCSTLVGRARSTSVRRR